MIKVKELTAALYENEIDFEIKSTIDLESVREKLNELGCDETDEMIDEMQGSMRVKNISLKTKTQETIFGGTRYQQMIIIEC